MSFVELPTSAAAGTATASPSPPPASVPAPAAVRGEVSLRMRMRHAGLREVKVGFELHGPDDAPVVLVAGGISAHRHVSASTAFPDKGWANDLVGPARALDPARLRILAFDYLGADGLLDTPIDTADQADAAAGLLDALGIAQLHAAVGYSYGALVGLQLAARHRRRLARLVAVSGTHRAHPYAAAWRALQRKVARLAQEHAAGHYGLSLARQFAMLSYRTPEEFAERFAAPPELRDGQARVAAEDYLEASGTRFAERTALTAWLRLSESIDLHRVDPAKIYVPTTVVAVEGDRLVPLSESVALVEGLRGQGRLRIVRSPFGHDAFLKETDRIDAILSGALRDGRKSAPPR